MKNLLAINLLALLGGLLIVSTPIRAQEKNEKQEKEVRIKTVKVEDGKRAVFDTTYILKDGEESIFFHTKDGEEIAIVKWIDDDGKEMEFNIDLEFDSSMNKLEEQLKELEIELEVIDGEHIVMLKNIKEIEGLAELHELKALKGLKEHEIFMIESGFPPPPPHPGSHHFAMKSHKVSDIELRDAGIKNKPNRLDAEEININVDNGVVDFSFKTKSEGNAKVTVYNVYGDKVFSGKPELMNGSYEIKMDLSKKQYGMYYLQVVMGNSSFTERLKL